MAYESWFDTNENQALLAICARKLIKNVGVGSLVWGVINIVAGILAMQVTLLNVGILMLGLLMLGSGLYALVAPSLWALLAATITAVLLFLWNVGISVLNYFAAGTFDFRGLIFPVIIALAFASEYRKLRPLREQIVQVKTEEIKNAQLVCKHLNAKKVKQEPLLAQTSDGKCRVQLFPEKAFFVQKDLMRAFIAPRESVRNVIDRFDAPSLKMKIAHPMGDLKYSFDRKNSEKFRVWLNPPQHP